MYHYRISAGNPEGTDWTIFVDHEKEFKKDEFNEITEQAFVYAFEKEFKNKKYACISSINADFVCEYLFSKGFVSSEKVTCEYYLEPYWDKESIKSKKLLQWINRVDAKDLP